MNYKAWIIREDNGRYTRAIEERSTDDLPQGDVLIRVHYAGLNYKDGLSSAGHKGITRKFPHQPGIDAAGVVVSDTTSTFAEGDKVICTSFDLGMNTAGGFGEHIRVPAGWCVPLPDGLTLEESMIHGSGGYTAALALYKMEQNGQKPEMGPICVTGATGGVGSLAVAILAQAGYEVIASTGKPEEHTYLQSLGSTEIIDRDEVNDESGKPLLRPKWAGAIDNVGGNTLATLLKCCGRNGSVACIGLVASEELQTTVFPFILNGINLLGIESAYTPLEIRTELWNRLANQWRVSQLHDIKTVISLEDLDEYFDLILQGKTRGRVVVKHDVVG
jgi:acrylyl-CoA reductase (NADPH)